MTKTRLLRQKEGAEASERESKRSWASEKEGKLGPLVGGTTGAAGAAEGECRVLEGLQRLWRQECIGAFSVHSDAGWRLGRCNLGLNLSCDHVYYEFQPD